MRGSTTHAAGTIYLVVGGEVVATWLMKIFHVIVALRVLPDSLKSGVIIPVYKGSRRDLLLPGSYRGISLSSTMSKVLKTLYASHVTEANIPHLNILQESLISCLMQHKKSSLDSYLRNGSHTFMCLYNFEKAVEYSVLAESKSERENSCGGERGKARISSLFLLVMNPLPIGINLSVNEFFAGGFLHVNDTQHYLQHYLTGSTSVKHYLLALSHWKHKC